VCIERRMHGSEGAGRGQPRPATRLLDRRIVGKEFEGCGNTIESLSRIFMRLSLPNMSMVITSAPCLKVKQVD